MMMITHNYITFKIKYGELVLAIPLAASANAYNSCCDMSGGSGEDEDVVDANERKKAEKLNE